MEHWEVTGFYDEYYHIKNSSPYSVGGSLFSVDGQMSISITKAMQEGLFLVFNMIPCVTKQERLFLVFNMIPYLTTQEGLFLVFYMILRVTAQEGLFLLFNKIPRVTTQERLFLVFNMIPRADWLQRARNSKK